MPSVLFFNIRFTPSWLMTTVAAILIAIFVRMGFWQIQRADEKKSMMQAQATQAIQAPINWAPGSKLPNQYQKIRLQGHFLPTVFLLDNQHQRHQFGYDVVSPLELTDKSIVLVDRGWVAGDVTRQTLPEVSVPTGLMKIEGSTYFPSLNSWVLGQESEQKTNRIFIVERLDTKMLGQILQKSIYPFIIRLEKHQEHGFVRKWAVVSMPAQRHLAYAVQWFAMALAIFIIFIVVNVKKNEKKDKF